MTEGDRNLRSLHFAPCGRAPPARSFGGIALPQRTQHRVTHARAGFGNLERSVPDVILMPPAPTRPRVAKPHSGVPLARRLEPARTQPRSRGASRSAAACTHGCPIEADVYSYAPIDLRRCSELSATRRVRLRGSDSLNRKFFAACLTNLRKCRTTIEGSPRRDARSSGAFGWMGPLRRRYTTPST